MSIAIELDQVSKRFRREWVLRGVNLSLRPGGRYALKGPNGAGKSTLMRILSGHLSPTRGERRYRLGGKDLPVADVYKHLAYAAPYIELIEEFTLEETLRFQEKFKPWLPGIDHARLYRMLGFTKARNKQVRHFSSGMRQRLKLLLSLASQSGFLLLDEPTTNLDRQGVRWYHDLVESLVVPYPERLVVVASNVEEDFAFCRESIDVMAFKGRPKKVGT